MRVHTFDFRYNKINNSLPLKNIVYGYFRNREKKSKRRDLNLRLIAIRT